DVAPSARPVQLAPAEASGGAGLHREPRAHGGRRAAAAGLRRLGAAAPAPAAGAPDPGADGGGGTAQRPAFRGSRRMMHRDAVPIIGPRDQQRFERLITWYIDRKSVGS